jgi:beta-glucosidase
MFGRGVASVAAALSLPGAARGAEAEVAAPSDEARKFPEGFLWGSATASYQVEGGVEEGGRGQTIWDVFSHIPGKTHKGDTGDVADDFYHRYRDDIKLMQGVGVKTFRFSLAWSRIFPLGTGAPNQAGIDFYSRLLDALLEAGIQPYGTLYHWDLPQALQEKGGWAQRATSDAFAHYAGFVAGKYADRLKHIMTTNEIRTFVELGYRDGSFAPGIRLEPGPLAQLTHNTVLGHGLAVRAIRAAAPGTQVGLAENPTATCPVVNMPDQVEAARRAFREENAQYLTVILEGRYTESYLKKLGANAPKFTAEEMAIIGSKLDFVGMNIYQPTWVRAAEGPDGYAIVPPPASYPAMFSSWLTVGPEAIYWGPRFAKELWNVPAIYITENGASSADTVTPDGHVYDTDRVMYLRNYLMQLQRTIQDGAPVKGYFLWSLLDNFEWADGYDKRFGITYVDFATQRRILKLSSTFYKQTIANNSVA